jgi:hypothetical protein
MRSISCDLTKTNQGNSGTTCGCQGNITLYLVINIYVCLIPSKSVNNWLKQFTTSLTSITEQEGLAIFLFLQKKMFEILVSIGQITLMSQKPFRPPYPKWYEPNQTCEYYDGLIRYNIENYHSFKDKHFQLIKAGWIVFKG